MFFFGGVFSGRSSRKNTTCGATHQVHVGFPPVTCGHTSGFIRQTDSIEAGDSPLRNQGEQLP
jgi:hypothetical protein